MECSHEHADHAAAPVQPVRPVRLPPAGASHDPAPRTAGGWHWRGAVAGAVAGGVLAASVAVPVTLGARPASTSRSTASSGPAAPQQGRRADGPRPAGPAAGGTDGFGGGLGQDPYGDSTSTGETTPPTTSRRASC